MLLMSRRNTEHTAEEFHRIDIGYRNSKIPKRKGKKLERKWSPGSLAKEDSEESENSEKAAENPEEGEEINNIKRALRIARKSLALLLKKLYGYARSAADVSSKDFIPDDSDLAENGGLATEDNSGNGDGKGSSFKRALSNARKSLSTLLQRVWGYSSFSGYENSGSDIKKQSDVPKQNGCVTGENPKSKNHGTRNTGISLRIGKRTYFIGLEHLYYYMMISSFDKQESKPQDNSEVETAPREDESKEAEEEEGSEKPLDSAEHWV